MVVVIATVWLLLVLLLLLLRWRQRLATMCDVVFDFVVCLVSMIVIALVVVKSLSPAEYLRRHIHGDWLPYC